MGSGRIMRQRMMRLAHRIDAGACLADQNLQSLTISSINTKSRYGHTHCQRARSGIDRYRSSRLEVRILIELGSVEKTIHFSNTGSLTSPSCRPGTGQSFTSSSTSGGPVFFTTTARMMFQCCSLLIQRIMYDTCVSLRLCWIFDYFSAQAL